MAAPHHAPVHLPAVLAALAALCCASPPRSPSQGFAMTRVPRGAAPPLEHRLRPEQILQRLQAAEADCDRALAALAGLPDASRTFANTVEALEQAREDYSDAAQRLGVLKDVHPDHAVRQAAALAEESAGKYLIKIASRRDLFRAVDAWATGNGAREVLDLEQRRLLELMRREFRRNGLELPDDKLARLVSLRTRLAELATDFSRNLNENADRIEVTDAELKGLPAAYVDRLSKAKSGARLVTTKYPDYYPFMDNAVSAQARRRLYLAMESREATRNLPLLKEALRLRDEAARLLGYPSHADFVAEDQMAGDARKVVAFLDSLQKGLKPRRDADLARMLALKRDETGEPAAFLDPWDVAYYLNQIKKRDFELDGERIREFFPVGAVLKGMFRVYQTLFDLDIREVAGADVWAPEVRLYEVRDGTSGGHLGTFYTDLYPRVGKYGHAASAPVTVARQAGREYRAPISVLIANFNPPTRERPSLLAHEEVKTLFHEFGHVMHQVLTTARYGSQSGTAVPRDFVEAPSQMLENWVYEKVALDLMGGHFQDPSRKLDEATVARIKQARTFDAGWHYSRQLFLARLDQALHAAGGADDPAELSRRLYREILGIEPAQGTHFPATFNHLMVGYDAGYYGYLWAEALSDDMFEAFAGKGLLDPGLGRRYREVVLARGHGREPRELLREFLGRDPSDAAFLKKLGIR